MNMGPQRTQELFTAVSSIRSKAAPGESHAFFFFRGNRHNGLEVSPRPYLLKVTLLFSITIWMTKLTKQSIVDYSSIAFKLQYPVCGMHSVCLKQCRRSIT